VIDIYWERDGKRYADAGLIVRVVGHQIIIERDMNDKPLVDALTHAGIPRTQIILAYAGEPVPEMMLYLPRS
jgi:XisI protein